MSLPTRDVPDVSVVVPVYNVEPFLRECLDSIAAQTLANIEILCVNDGSTDGSLAIMREYEARDPRFRVIDKPNGGYGHSVNRGIDEAQGTYVAIVEPDDLIERHMLADLVAASTFGGSAADIVKSSYWNYYAPDDGSEPYVKKTNLMKRMPSRRMRFTIHEKWEVLYHHPSVWSALYRRGFLKEKGIRLIEPKGAGWADNPFFFETMLQASSIVWVPAAYYFYRQTNPESSSYLKDYHLPFDRLRDIHSILVRLGETDPHILVCFYNRIFSYIRSVQEKFGYAETDPELFSLIREALGYMIPEVVFGAKRGLKKQYVDYYKDVMGYRIRRFKPRRASSSPRASVVVPMLDCRPVLYDCLEGLARQSERDIEVLCVDLGSCDRSLAVARAVSELDERFSTLSLENDDMGGLLEAVLEWARSPFVCFVDSRDELAPGHIRAMRRAFEGTHVDSVLLARSFPYVASASRCRGLSGVVSVREHMAELACSISAGSSHLGISTGALGSACHALTSLGGYCYPALALTVLQVSGSAALCTSAEPSRHLYRPAESPLALLEHRSLKDETRLYSALPQMAKLHEQFDEMERQALRSMLAELFVLDLDELENSEERKGYVAELSKDAIEALGVFEASPGSYPNQRSFQSLATTLLLNDSAFMSAGALRSPLATLSHYGAKALEHGRRCLPTRIYRVLQKR